MTNMSNDLTPGQDYAVKFLTSKGFKLISSPIQLKRGNLVFDDPLGNKWGIFKNGGYIRKQTPKADRWGVVFRLSGAGASQMDDDQYMDLAEMISVKYNADLRKEQKGKETLGEYHKKVSFWEVYKYRDGFRVRDMTCYVPLAEIKKALDIIVKEGYMQNLSVKQLYDEKTADAIEVYGYYYEPESEIKSHYRGLARKVRIIFFNDSDEIGYTSVIKQYGRVKRQSDPLIWDIPTLISL